MSNVPAAPTVSFNELLDVVTVDRGADAVEQCGVRLDVLSEHHRRIPPTVYRFDRSVDRGTHVGPGVRRCGVSQLAAQLVQRRLVVGVGGGGEGVQVGSCDRPLEHLSLHPQL